MKKHSAKILAALLACLLLLAACAPGAGGDATTAATTAAATKAATTAGTTAATTAATTTTAGPPELEFMELTYVSWNCGAIVDGNWAEKQLEDRFNVEIKTAKVDLSQAQQLDLMLASGEMPDCGWILKTSPAMDEQGLIRTVSEDMIREYAPNYAALLDSEPLGWKMNVSPDNGEYLALTGYAGGNIDSASYMSFYRLDWLEALGIEPNGELVSLDEEGRLFMTTKPFTISQFLEIMEAFTKGDPDGNGEADTVGMAAGARNQFSWFGLYGAFGFSPNGTLNVDGRAENYYVTENYKEFLRFAASLYADGYLDKEFATLDMQKSFEKIAAGKAGFSGSHWGWVGPGPTYAATRPPMNIINQTDGKSLCVPTEVADDGSGGAAPYTFSNYNYTFYVNRDVDDVKLVRILQIFDYANFDPEAMIYLRYGEEGKHFTFTGADGKSGPVLKEGVTNGGEFGLWVYNANYVAPKAIKELGWDPTLRTVMNYTWGELKNNLTFPYRLDLFNETNLAELNSTYGATLGTLVDEFFYNVVGGELNLDAEWDNYIATLYKAGYQEISDELQKAPLYTDLVK